MKKIITTLVLALITTVLAMATTNEPDKMYVHMTTLGGADSIVIFQIIDIDSIVYYAASPSLSTTAATEITAEGATLGGEITSNGGAIITERGIEYSATINFTNGTGTTLAASTNEIGTYNVAVAGLETGTIYYYKAYAINAEGTSYGDQLNFTPREPTSGTFTDSRDTKTYNWVKIGTQVWMAENLAYLPQITDKSTLSNPVFIAIGLPAYGVYGYEGWDKTEAKANDNYSTYGVLYNWYAAMDGDASPNGVQGVCPSGWHLPSGAEWTILEGALTDNNKGSQLAANADLWNEGPLTATDKFGTSGFTALPGGIRNYDGTFSSVNDHSYWWSSTLYLTNRAYSRDLNCLSSTLNKGYNLKSFSLSVRCIKDSPEPQAIDWDNTTEGVTQADVVTDADGNSYSAVKIGDQVWMTENLSTTKDSVGTAISHVADDTNWGTLGDNNTNAAYCWYGDNSDNKATYGALYTYSAALKACPIGWHLPSNAEWTTLTDHLSGDAANLKATTGWNGDGNGNNNYHFAALPGGYRDGSGACSNVGNYGAWWSSTEYNTSQVHDRLLRYDDNIVYNDNVNKSDGYSIRCLKNMPVTTPNLSTTAATDIDAEGATLGGDITDNGGATVTARGIEYSLTEDFTEGSGTPVAASTNGTGTYDVTLTGLEANTIYYYKAYATNAEGTSYSDQLNFTPSEPTSGTFTDNRDNNTYNWVKIGEQVWMAQNLAYLPQVDDNSTFVNATDARYGVSGYDGTNVNAAKAEDNYSIYGVYYNWYAAMAYAANSETNPSGVKGACPTDWHLPSDAEWATLEGALSEDYKGSQLIASSDLWYAYGDLKWNTRYVEPSGFAALPYGTRSSTTGLYTTSENTDCSWWSTTNYELSGYKYVRNLMSPYSRIMRSGYTHSSGLTIRCIKD